MCEYLKTFVVTFQKQQEMDNEASTYPSQDGTPSRHTTPHYTSGRDDTEITPRSILKSSNTPTPQKKTVKFVDDFDDNATSTSTIVMDVCYKQLVSNIFARKKVTVKLNFSSVFFADPIY